MSLGVTSAQVLPPSRVTWIIPSSDPVQITLTSIFDGARANTVAYTSGPFMSPVMGPPECPSVFGSCFVRSPLIRVQSSPLFVVFQTCWVAVNRTLGSAGEKTIGYVHCTRSGIALAGSPENMRGNGWTSRL
jgi:hypothetical protein